LRRNDWGDFFFLESCDHNGEGGGCAWWSYVSTATLKSFSGLTDVHLVLVLRNDGYQLVYLDGVLTMTASVPLEPSTFKFNYLGTPIGDNDYSMMSGSIDEIRIWSTVLKPYDIVYHTILGPNGK